MNVPAEQSPFLDKVEPFALDARAKDAFLAARLAVLRDYHRARCDGYARLLADWPEEGSDAANDLGRYPYVPVSVFKEFELRSTDRDLAIVESSATTSAHASRIFVDKESRKRQARSANLILADFIGSGRRPYLVFDLEETVRGGHAFSARGAAIMALGHLASSFHFVMRRSGDGLELDTDALRSALDVIGEQPFIAYGFTFILFQAHRAMETLRLSRAHPDSVLLHSGGWKKLVDLAVDKATFNATVAAPWGLDPGRVIDFYGTVEQVGIPYPDCSEGLKHVPYWADVLTRRADTLDVAGAGESGLIQLLNCLPLAAPNHSVLTEDLGRIVLEDGCACGRRGKGFIFEGRAPRSEVRGCSDVARG